MPLKGVSRSMIVTFLFLKADNVNISRKLIFFLKKSENKLTENLKFLKTDRDVRFIDFKNVLKLFSKDCLSSATKQPKST